MLLHSLEKDNFLQLVLDLEKNEGKDILQDTLKTYAEPEYFLEKMKEEIDAKKNKKEFVIFITGVGKVFPFLRSHMILNHIENILEHIPVILFFPGSFDGFSLKLFNKMKDENYYRAFPLI
jgi:hypothetical protein